MNEQRFTIFILNPEGLVDPGLAIAGSRAGAVGILDAGPVMADADLASGIDRLSRYARNAFGVKFSDVGAQTLELALRAQKRGLSWLILDADSAVKHAAILKRFRKRNGAVLCEITAWDDQLNALAQTVDGWWAKGAESGGRIGSSFASVLLQEVLAKTDLPVYVRGGINPHSAAGCRVSGAAGIVLDDQLLLLKNSPLAAPLAAPLRSFTGQETAVVETDCGTERRLRLWAPPMWPSARALRQRLASSATIAPEDLKAVGWPGNGREVAALPIGQAAAFAPAWREAYGSVGSVIEAIRTRIETAAKAAIDANLLGVEAPLAVAHGTRFAIVQGPMTHVSDNPAFIQAVAEGGALPMLAVSLNKGDHVRRLLMETRERLGDRPWGVGLLGFVPADILKDQRDAIREARPRWAIIAGGRPDQARSLEDAGIRTYLHVPSPQLLKQFLDEGSRSFIFEGRECGGHVGPLSSFVLWGQMIDALLDHPCIHREGDHVHALFAGGIHDARSAAAVAAIAAPLAEAGVRIGLLIGTGYVFTREAVETGAITRNFQHTVIGCEATAELTTGPGHVSRCALTPFVDQFQSARKDLERSGVSAEAVREELERMNLGRLRLATKGLFRQNEARGELSPISVEEQRDGGMFMIGQAAGLRDQPTTIADLHDAVTGNADRWLRAQCAADRPIRSGVAAHQSADIAIVGMGCIVPGADTTRRFWETILDKASGISEIPLERWDWRAYFDAEPAARDRIYSRWGGFIDPVRFDPMEWGIPPASLSAIDPLQLLALEVVRQAVSDAGLTSLRLDDRDRTSVILGFSGGMGEVGLMYGVRSEIPRIVGKVDQQVLDRLPEWTEDSFAGLLPNVAAGRVANRFDFRGVNFTVDAACASSLAAVYQAALELESGRSDTVIAGGINSLQSPFGYLCFSKTHALSPTGRCRTFDAKADGIVISEGLATVVLKRLADAERDGDRIYAVIKGIGGSSDGRAKGMTAPLPAGQQRALRRAYGQAGYPLSTVGLIEAHGTGTVAGDHAELETVIGLLHGEGAQPATCAIGSVKTNIGHTKAAAGMAELIKAALAVHHRVLPPHSNVDEPNPVLADAACPVFLGQEARPWVADPDHPRRAGVSSFGFGGTNFHVTLEEYHDEHRSWLQPSPPRPLAYRTIRMAGRNPRRRSPIRLAAFSPVWRTARRHRLSLYPRRSSRTASHDGVSVAIVAGSHEQLCSRLRESVRYLVRRNGVTVPPPGVFITSRESGPKGGKVAVLFSGQGAQYPDMLREVAVIFRELPDRLTDAARILRGTPTFLEEGQRSLSSLIYPPDRFTPENERAARAALTRTEIAQPALGAVEMGLWDLVRAFDIRADMVAGHSYGEYAALSAAEVLSLEDLLLLSEARGRCIIEASAGNHLGTMAAVPTDGESVRRMLDSNAGVVCANLNGPEQTILSGTLEEVKDAVERLEMMGQSATFLPVAAGFHSPLMQPAREPFAAVLAARRWRRPKMPVYSNTTARPHSGEPAKIRAQLANHLVEPVNFVGMIEAMYDEGARTFLELGPKSILGDLVGTILRGRPHLSVSVDGRGGGLSGFLAALASLFVEGVSLSLDRLFEGRTIPPLNLDDLTLEADAQTNRRRTWLVDGSRVRPAEGQTGAPKRENKERDSAGPAIPQAPSRPRQPTDAAEQSQSPGIGGIQHENHAGAQPAHQDMCQNQKKEEVFEMADDWKPTLSPPGNGTEQIMNAYHQTMRQFLQMQERVMMTYLGSSAGEGFPNTSAPMDVSSTQSLPMPTSSSCSAQPSTVGGAQPRATTTCAAPELDSLSAREVLAEHTAPPTPPPAHGKGNGNGQSEVDTPDFRAALLGIVSERTGYPEDVLDLGQDLEADLGIDSIKRVEILGAFRKSLPASMGERLRDHMDGLSGARSLGAILDFVEGTLGKETLRPFDPAGVGDVEKACAPLPRYRMRAHAEPVPTHHLGSLPRGLYLLTPDETGTAAALSRRLEAESLVPVVIPASVLANETALVQWLVEQRSSGPIRALVHLTPLDGRPIQELDGLDDWRGRIERDVKSPFSLLRLLADDLMTGGCVITTSAMGGRFGRDILDRPERPAVFPSGAGNVGLVKALGFEWPDCACKAVDLDPGEAAESWAEHIHAELAWRGSRPEVGYPEGNRVVFVTDSAILSEEPMDDRRPDEHWVVLAVGGARGITAETLRPLAEAKATLVLVGRSAFPEPESAETRALVSPEMLRSHFFGHAADTGESLTPVAIEERVRAVLAAREMRANVDDFERMGARVDYRCVDTRNDADVGTLFNSIYATYGRIDAVVHGGGVIEDRLLINKSQDSVDRVFDTKADTAFLIARHLRPETLKFVAFYTSVAGRYGNAGQTDYAAANETLNRFAWVLQSRWGPSVKVSAINWGPWDVTTNGSGMVTPETRRKFERNGVVLVEAEAGRDFLIREIMHSFYDDVEVIAGDGPWRQDIAGKPQPSKRHPDAAAGASVAPHAAPAGEGAA